MKQIKAVAFLMLLALAGCAGLASPPGPTPTPEPATVRVTLDLGSGGTGFGAVIFAQEVASGQTYSLPYTSGSHGGVVLEDQPITFTIDVPGTYVFYGYLINAPESYHFGATGCPPATDCPSSDLVGFDISLGGAYQVTISDRSAPIPTPHAPVTVPWRR